MSDQRGFSLVESLLAIIAVTLIGFTGFYVYSSNQSEPKTNDSIVKTGQDDKSDTSKSVNDQTASWLLYTPPDKEFTIRLADGWNLVRNEAGTGFYTTVNDNLKFEEGVKAVLTAPVGGKDANSGFSLNYRPIPGDGRLFSNESVKQAGFTTNDGVTVDKYQYTETRTIPEGLGQLDEGGVYYSYVIKTNANMVMTVNYDVQPTDDQHFKIIEEVLRTVHFN